MGRRGPQPTLTGFTRVVVYLSPEQIHALRRISQRLGLDRSSVLRAIIDRIDAATFVPLGWQESDDDQSQQEPQS